MSRLNVANPTSDDKTDEGYCSEIVQFQGGMVGWRNGVKYEYIGGKWITFRKFMPHNPTMSRK